VAKKPRDPFDITLTSEQRTTLAMWLVDEITNAQAARSSQETEVDYWHSLYEQARTRTKNLPWPDAADLTSYIPCEQVDSIHARLMRTVWTEPLCTVSGYGPGADRAPFVEEFHQWKVEEEGLQLILDKYFLMGLIEPRALLEVSESAVTRLSRKRMLAKVEQTPEGGMVYEESGDPKLAVDPAGKFIDAQPEELAAETIVDSPESVRNGPQYRVLPYRDSLIFPGHARDDQDIYGYGKRIWKRKADLLADAKLGRYDQATVEQIPDGEEQEPDAAMQRARMTVAAQRRETERKELWEVLVLVDVNDILTNQSQTPLRGSAFQGQRWYVATLHIGSQLLLRWQHDDLETARYIPLILFPRPDRATEGFSFVGHKLITVTEEHSAYRNMAADCCARAVNSPILRLSGSLWDPDEQPLGPKQVLDVRSAQDITPLQLPDVPQSVFAQIQAQENAGRRLGGVNDVAAGQQVEKGTPTLGEVQMATEQSFVRMDLIVRRAQKALEAIMQVRHAIWKRCLAEQPYGVEAPSTLTVGLEVRGTPIDAYLPDGKITAALLEGAFRFKPYGSVETADLSRQRNNLLGLMQALPMLLQIFGPTLGPILQQPQVGRAIFREFLRVMRFPNPQAFLGSPSQDLLAMTGAQMGPQVPMMGAPPLGGPMAVGMNPGMLPPPPLPSPLAPGPGMVQ
jgi:hypothetical protein